MYRYYYFVNYGNDYFYRCRGTSLKTLLKNAIINYNEYFDQNIPTDINIACFKNCLALRDCHGFIYKNRKDDPINSEVVFIV